MLFKFRILSKHRRFAKVMINSFRVFNNVKPWLVLSVWHSTFDSGENKIEIVKEKVLNVFDPVK